MRVRLALNHTFLEGLGALSQAQILERLAALRSLRVRADPHVFAADPLYCDRALALLPLGTGETPSQMLHEWLSQMVSTPLPAGGSPEQGQLRREIEWLLREMARGPFWQDLPNPIEASLAVEPDLAHAAEHARSLVVHGLGYLSQRGVPPLCVLSPSDLRNLTEDRYRSQVADGSSLLRNLRTKSELTSYAEQAADPGRFRTVEDVFRLIEHELAGAVLILPSARASAQSFDWVHCGLKDLLRCLMGLRYYKEARDQGQSEQEALRFYQEVTGIEATLELRITMLKEKCVARRTFSLPDGRTARFEPHAKPRKTAPRVHFLWEQLPDQPSVVYVGHCGEHLPT